MKQAKTGRSWYTIEIQWMSTSVPRRPRGDWEKAGGKERDRGVAITRALWLKKNNPGHKVRVLRVVVEDSGELEKPT